MKLNLVKSSILCLTLSCFTAFSHANDSTIGGISLGATRVIYPIDAKQVSLPIINHSQKDRYLINSWVEDNHEEKTKDFLITPPLFVAEAKTENTLRIISLATQLPQDRESVFWINVKAIPSIDKSTLVDKNVLQLAVLSRIKLFVRPKGLTLKPEAALEKLTFSNTAQGIEVNNPSPYHVSFVNLYVDNVKIENVMAAPLSNTRISKVSGHEVSYQTVNDFGGLTPKFDLKLK